MQSAHEKVVGISETLYDHTYLLWVLVVAMIFVTLVQFHDPWPGDMWAFPEYEWALRHEWVGMVDEILGPLDEEGYSLGHFYNDSVHAIHVHGPDHPTHAAHIQRMLESHWESALLTWVVHLNFLLFFSILARYYFCWQRQTLRSIFFLLIIFTVSGVAQFVAVGLRVGVITFTFSLWALGGLLLNCVCLFIEIAAFVEIYHARATAMFMNKQYTKLPSEHQELIGAELAAETERHKKEESKRSRRKKNSFAFINHVIHMLTAARNSITEDCVARQYNLPPKEKMH